jgi:hypothetical protein
MGKTSNRHNKKDTNIEDEYLGEAGRRKIIEQRYLVFDKITKETMIFNSLLDVHDYFGLERSFKQANYVLNGEQHWLKRRYGVAYNCRVLWNGKFYDNIFVLAEYLGTLYTKLKFLVDYECDWVGQEDEFRLLKNKVSTQIEQRLNYYAYLIEDKDFLFEIDSIIAKKN